MSCIRSKVLAQVIPGIESAIQFMIEDVYALNYSYFAAFISTGFNMGVMVFTKSQLKSNPFPPTIAIAIRLPTSP